MIRFFITFVILLIGGRLILALFSPELANQFALGLFSLLVIAIVLKVAVDIYLHWRKEEEDEDNFEALQEPEGRVFHNIRAFNKALASRYRQKKQARKLKQKNV